MPILKIDPGLEGKQVDRLAATRAAATLAPSRPRSPS